MIIWNKLGFLVIAIAGGCFLLTELSVEAVTNDDKYYQDHAWPMLAAAAVAGVMIWFLGLYLNQTTEERELVDPRTGEVVVIKSGGGHSLFFIPMQYWAPIVMMFALFLAVKKWYT